MDGILLLRLAVGLVLAAHGSQKLFGAFGGPGLHGTAGHPRGCASGPRSRSPSRRRSRRRAVLVTALTLTVGPRPAPPAPAPAPARDEEVAPRSA
jgi:uncharacterized membrane protein YphA (DoxX/SURF4 family)